MTVILFVVMALGCVDPIRLVVDDGVGMLVVDGLITDQAGPFVIKLSRSLNFDNRRVVRVYPVPEKNAIVTISDNHGRVQNGIEDSKEAGSYRFENLQGAVGDTYTLFIRTAEGKEYVSEAEVMLPTQPIERLEWELKIYDRLFVNANGDPRIMKMDAFFIYAVVKDPTQTGNYYRWQSDGIFEFFSVTDNPAIKQCWAPIPRLETKVELADDTYKNGQEFKQLVCIIPYDRPTQFLVKIRQQSLTEKAHEFWGISQAQQISTGSLFDAPPAQARGNMRNTENAEELVLGYFGASSIYSTSLLLERFKDAGLVPPGRPIPLRAGDCRTHEIGATNIKPPGFK